MSRQNKKGILLHNYRSRATCRSERACLVLSRGALKSGYPLYCTWHVFRFPSSQHRVEHCAYRGRAAASHATAEMHPLTPGGLTPGTMEVALLGVFFSSSEFRDPSTRYRWKTSFLGFCHFFPVLKKPRVPEIVFIGFFKAPLYLSKSAIFLGGGWYRARQTNWCTCTVARAGFALEDLHASRPRQRSGGSRLGPLLQVSRGHSREGPSPPRFSTPLELETRFGG